MNKTIKTIISLVVLALIVWGITAFNSSNSTLPMDEPIKVGALSILSGAGSAWGENAKKGIDLAVSEINDNGGIDGREVEIVYEDTKGDAKTAISALQKLITLDKVTAVIGPLFQQETAAISPIATTENIPIITPSYSPVGNHSVVYNPLMIWMDPPTEAQRMADFVYEQGVRRVAVIGTVDNWEMTVSDEFEKRFEYLGGEVVFKDLLQTDSTDSRTSVLKALDKKPEAIFLGTYYQFVNLVKQIKELGFDGLLYSIEVNSYLANETAPFSEGIQFISPDFYADDFILKFKNVYGEEPGIPVGQAYDATKILLSFIEKNPDDIISQMKNFRQYSGASGEITITNNHLTLLPTAIFEVKNGSIVKYE